MKQAVIKMPVIGMATQHCILQPGKFLVNIKLYIVGHSIPSGEVTWYTLFGNLVWDKSKL